MYEVELKVPATHGAVRDRLEAAGADRLGTVEQTDTYYDAPDRDFAATDEALRLRTETTEGGGDATTRLTYKGPLVDAATKTREEHETGVTDADATAALLRGLGYEPAAVVEKTRERFRLDGYTVTLDTVADLGEFVEVEREVPEADVAAARDGAVAVLERLGLDPTDGIRTSYLGLLLEADADPAPDTRE